MTKEAPEMNHIVEEHIYVAADGVTVVPSDDKRVAFLKYAKGKRITDKQFRELRFPAKAPQVAPTPAK